MLILPEDGAFKAVGFPEIRFMVKSAPARLLWKLILLLPIWGAGAQDITDTKWYFGSGPQNLIFDKNGRDAVLEDDMATAFGTNGSAVISDQFTGNLLFYSDGQVVYDRNHELVPSIAGGANLSGDLALNQPVVACPVPGQANQFYFFTNNPTEIQASIVDASLTGNSAVAQFPSGDLTSINQPTGLLTPAEGMIIIEADVLGEYWLISQNRSTFDFQATRISASGLSTTTSTVFSGTLPAFEVAQFAFNEDSLQLAVAPKTANRNVLILDFDLTSGALSLNQQIRNTGFADTGATAIYDVEWSRSGNKLYISRQGDGTNRGNLYQIDLADTVNSPFPVNTFLPYDFARSYGLKRAIDDRIYHLYQPTEGGPFLLGRIVNPDSVAAAVLYDSLVFDEDFNGTQFPAFAPASFTNFTTFRFEYLDSCQRNATKFFPIVEPKPSSYLWIFGTEGISDAVSPIFTFQNPGAIQVTLLAELNGRVTAFTDIVNILTNSDSVNLGNDTTICVDETLILDGGSTGVQFLWSTGELTQTIEVDTAGTYWVEVTYASGCTAFGDIIVTEYGVSRQIGSQWYFGETAGLDFTTGAPVPITDANLMSSPEGCASISDINGSLLFYTNGSTVWNKDHEVMENGYNIGGDSTAAQSALIMPVAGDNTIFYIFTTQEVYGTFTYDLKLSMVDMKHDTARGRVVKKDITLVHNSSERITGSGFTGTPYVLSHEYGNRDFRVNQITPDGLQRTIHTSIGEPHRVENALSATGYTKFAPSTTLMAMLIPGDSNQVELLNFDLTTGVLSNPRLINLDEPAPAQAYGLEFSEDERRLYITMTDPTPKLIQLDLDSLFTPDDIAEIEASKFEYVASLPGFGALQLGPDGVIYMAVENQLTVGTISSPGGDNETAGFDPTGQDLAGRTSRRGLPNFTQSGGSSLQTPSISVTIGCVGITTSFAGTGRDSSIEEYNWDFGDGTTTAGQNVTHIYTTPGSYLVTLSLTNRCDTLLELTRTVDVFSIPEQPQVPSQTALCGGQVTLNAWDVDRPDLNYWWSTGDTSRSVTFFSPTIVQVAIINDDGCSSDTVDVFIADGGQLVDLGTDRILCQNDPAPTLDSFNPGPVYSWTVDGMEVGTERTQEINTNFAGTFTYAVAATNTITGCVARDSIQVTIQPEPGLEQANIVPPDCGEANGEFELTFRNAGSYSYEISGPVNLGPFTFDGPGNPPAFSGLSAGSYLATATNVVTGCVNTEVLLLEDNGAFEMNAIAVDDCARTSDIRITVQDLVGSRVDVNVRDDDGALVFSELNRRATDIRVEDLDTGLYYVEVRQVATPFCIQTDTVQLNVSVRCFRTIFAPNAFSPNGNAVNEQYFVFPNDYIGQFQIFIYNRWGEIIYTSQDKNFRWDGTFNSLPAPPGVYAYKMVFRSTLEPELGDLTQYGSITLIR